MINTILQCIKILAAETTGCNKSEYPCAKSTGRQKSKQIYSVIVRLDPRIKHAL